MRWNGRSNRVRLSAWICVAGSLTACDAVDGGAAELSWKLRPASSATSDKFVDCASGKDGTNPVTEIRLDWESENGVAGAQSWSCDDSYGVTGFALPPGPTRFRVSPICAFGPAVPGSYIAPAVELRNVILGDTVSLGAVELVVQVSSCDLESCICE